MRCQAARAALVCAMLTGAGAHAGAQAVPSSVGDVRLVEGRVVHPDREHGDSSGMATLPGVWVTLHRVGKDRAGPLDSVRTDASGTYRFRYAPSGEGDAVYFASVSWAGIAYFTPPLRSAVTRDDEAEISVFDTTSVTFPLTVRGRHLIVSAADSTDSRTVIEVFELSNDSTRALVSAEGAGGVPTWSIAVPSAARDVRAQEGDVSVDAFAFAPGRVSVFAPIAPGIKQISFSYRLPASSFPATFAAEHGAVVFEVLLEEPQGKVASAGFTMVEPVTLESRHFRRFLGQDVKAGAPVLVDLPASRAPGRNLYISGLLVGIGFLMLLVLSRAVSRRGNATAVDTLAAHRQRVPDAPLHERLAAEIAALDATFSRQVAPGDAVRTAYEHRRRELVGALADALGQPAPDAHAVDVTLAGSGPDR